MDADPTLIDVLERITAALESIASDLDDLNRRDSVWRAS